MVHVRQTTGHDFVPGKEYTFPEPVEAKCIPDAEQVVVRFSKGTFTTGKFLRHDDERRASVFRGPPIDGSMPCLFIVRD
jgi:hypothetical protein